MCYQIIHHLLDSNIRRYMCSSDRKPSPISSILYCTHYYCSILYHTLLHYLSNTHTTHLQLFLVSSPAFLHLPPLPFSTHSHSLFIPPHNPHPLLDLPDISLSTKTRASLDIFYSYFYCCTHCSHPH